MANAKLNRTAFESEIISAFRQQFPNLQILLKGEKVTLDKDGELGFNPIPENDFCGPGTYSMHGWVKVFRCLGDNGIQSHNTKFDVTVIIEYGDDGLEIKFSQPIFLQLR